MAEENTEGTPVSVPTQENKETTPASEVKQETKMTSEPLQGNKSNNNRRPNNNNRKPNNNQNRNGEAKPTGNKPAGN